MGVAIVGSAQHKAELIALEVFAERRRDEDRPREISPDLQEAAVQAVLRLSDEQYAELAVSLGAPLQRKPIGEIAYSGQLRLKEELATHLARHIDHTYLGGRAGME